MRWPVIKYFTEFMNQRTKYIYKAKNKAVLLKGAKFGLNFFF